MRLERLFLIVAGALVFALGTWPHRNRPTPALALVVIGGVLIALGVILPYLQGLQGSVAGVTVQIALAQLPAPLSAEPLGELRGEVLPDSGSQAFVKMLRNPGKSAYSVVSLGDGRQWLTSRLLVLSIVLQELRDVHCLVITSWLGDDAEDRLIGTVSPDDLRRAFAWEYPWLEAAVADAWQQIGAGAMPSKPNRLTPETADRLLHDVTVRLASAPPPSHGHPEWVNVRGRHEHARWVEPATLGTALGARLDHRRVTAASVGEVQPGTILAAGGTFVPLVDHENRFLALLDRTALLEARINR